MTDQERLELDPEAAAQRKRRAYRRLHALEFPLFRLIGMSLIVLVVLFFRPPDASSAWCWLVAGVPIGYSLLSWAILLKWDQLGVTFLFLDIPIYCFIIYLTGIEQSWFIFLLMIRVADQIPVGPVRTLAVTHVNLACYLLTLGYAAWRGHPVDLQAAGHKSMIVYLTGLYLSLSALTAKELHDKAAGALRLSRDLIGQMAERTRELEIANQTRSRFLANISHELRTPMNGVLGMLDLTLDTQLTEDQRTNLCDSRDSALALLQVLNHILDLGKLEAGRFTLELRPFELQELLQEIHAAFATRSTEKVKFELRCEDGFPVRVLGDRDRLRQIIVHLLDNAFKFTAAGKIVLTARCEPLESKVRLLIQVSDTGPGIGPDALARIFRPFERGDESLTRSHGGTGLGLAICRDLTQLMDGKLWAESLPGRGSDFWLQVPFELTRSPQGARSLRVLVAEDNPVNQRVCMSILERLGHRPVLASDGLQALAILQAETFDVVLMDIQMPGLSGLEVAHKVRELGNRVPIIALTASAELAPDQAIDGYLGKPLRKEKLQAVLENL